MTMTLFDIGEDMRALEQVMTELEGEVSDETVEKVLDAWFEANQHNLDDKLDDYCALIQNRDWYAKGRKAEEERLRALRITDENMITRLKIHLKRFFEEHKIERRETLKHKLWIQNNGGIQPMWFNEEYDGAGAEKLPEEYQMQVTIPNMELIRAEAEELHQLSLLHLEAAGQDGLHSHEALEAWRKEYGSRHDELARRLEGNNVAHIQPRGTHLRIK